MNIDHSVDFYTRLAKDSSGKLSVDYQKASLSIKGELRSIMISWEDEDYPVYFIAQTDSYSLRSGIYAPIINPYNISLEIVKNSPLSFFAGFFDKNIIKSSDFPFLKECQIRAYPKPKMKKFLADPNIQQGIANSISVNQKIQITDNLLLKWKKTKVHLLEISINDWMQNVEQISKTKENMQLFLERMLILNLIIKPETE